MAYNDTRLRSHRQPTSLSPRLICTAQASSTSGRNEDGPGAVDPTRPLRFPVVVAELPRANGAGESKASAAPDSRKCAEMPGNADTALQPACLSTPPPDATSAAQDRTRHARDVLGGRARRARTDRTRPSATRDRRDDLVDPFSSALDDTGCAHVRHGIRSHLAAHAHHPHGANFILTSAPRE